jgi:hypothetical protein
MTMSATATPLRQPSRREDEDFSWTIFPGVELRACKIGDDALVYYVVDGGVFIEEEARGPLETRLALVFGKA